MKSYLKAGVAVGLGLSLALVIGATLLSFRSLGEQEDAADSVTHTHLVIEGLETLRAEVLRAENARRCYALTGDPSFVTRFSTARDGLQETLGVVRTLAADNALQQKRLDELEPPIQKRVEQLEQSMRRPHSGPRDEFEAGLTLPGAVLTGQINALLRTMQDTEQDLLRARDAQAKQSARRTRLLLALGAAATLGLILGIFLLLRHEILAARSAEGRFRVALESAPDAVVTADQAGRIVMVNAQTEKLFGYAAGELLGRNIELLVPERLREAHTAHRASFAADPRARPMGADLDLRARRKDGSEFPVEISLSPFETPEGMMVSSAIRDVTERSQSAQQIQTLNETLTVRARQLEAANRELESFCSSVAHDLRAPLRHVDGFSRILLEEHGPQLGPQGQALAARVRHSAQHMGELVDDLLNLSRVSRREASPLVTDLNPLVQEVITGLQPACQGRHVEFRVAALPFAECDPGLMRQAFANLLANAVKFTRPRDPAIIEVGQTDRDGARAIFVRDNGVGFSMKYADKLFGVFQRLHRSEDFEGTGVGLVTVERIIQKHNGRIWAEAEVDKGAAFFFTLEGLEERRAPDSPRVPRGVHVGS